jgi:hypothetical protein
MATVTFTQAHLDALTEAYALGVTKIQIGDKVMEYRSLNDLWRAIQTIKESLNGTADTSKVSVNNVPYTYSKGR